MAILPFFAEGIKIKATDVGLPVSTPTFGAALSSVIGILVTFVGLLSVVFIVVGALKIVTSNGDPARYKSGRDTLTYAITGVILAIAAYAIVAFITDNVK